MTGSSVTPDDPFIMAILSRDKNANFGVAILNKMGEKEEQYTDDSSVVSSNDHTSHYLFKDKSLHLP